MLKRARDLYDTPCSSTPPHPPSKRAHTELTDSSPLAARSRSTFSTPFSYYSPRTPFSVPSDSPTNPFGLNRSLAALGLPPKTSFSKHITLRFQLIEHCTTTRPIRPRRVEKGGIYRVVQVPTNYSFRHLHKLILFLFASDIERLHKPRPAIPITARDRRVAAKNSARAVTREPGVSSSDPSSSHPSLEKWQGHSFEVLKQINIHSECTKPGIIKEGVTCAKLSSVRERRLFRDLFESSATALQASSSDIDEPDDDEEQSGWSWEAEDDYTLSYVWPRGPTLDKGIIYVRTQFTFYHG